MNIRTASWRFFVDRTGWPIMARTSFWSGRHPALLRAPSPATPGEAVTAHPRASLGPAIAFSLRDANAGHAVCGFMDNPFRGRLRRHVRQTGVCPQLHRRIISRRKGRYCVLLDARWRGTCRMTRSHRGMLPLTTRTRDRTRTERTDHELQKPDRLTSYGTG